MRAAQLKLWLKMAMDRRIDLSGVDDSILHGCGLRDFVPVTADIRTVAHLIRYQCLCMDGSWDWREWDECTGPSIHKRVMLAEIDLAETRKLVAGWVTEVLEGKECAK